MAFAHIAENHFESTPLLRHSMETADESFSSETRHIIPPKRKWRIVLLPCAFAFHLMLGDNLQPATLIQIYEAAICDVTGNPDACFITRLVRKAFDIIYTLYTSITSP